jgi:hypothetical protein
MQLALAGMSETLVGTDAGPGRSSTVCGDASQRIDRGGELVEGTRASGV